MSIYTRVTSFVPLTLGDANDVEAEFDAMTIALNERVDTGGALPMLAELEISTTSPSLLFTPDEGSSELFRIKEIVDTGESYLKIQTYETSAWVDIAVFPHSIGSVWTQFTDIKGENLWLDDSTPYLKFDGSETSGEVFRIMEDAGDLITSVYITDTYEPAITIDAAGDVEIHGTLTTGALDLSLNAVGLDVLKTAVDNELTGTIGEYVESNTGTRTTTITHAYESGEVLGSVPIYITVLVSKTGGPLTITPTYYFLHEDSAFRLKVDFEQSWVGATTYSFSYVIHIGQEN